MLKFLKCINCCDFFCDKMPLTSRPRSSSALRSGSSYSNSRPRSLGHYSSSSYNSPYSATSNPYSSFSNYNGYGSSYQSPYFPNGYRGAPAANGYASLTIASKTSKKSDHISRRDLARGSSYRERSLSRSSTPFSSGLNSRSISLTSLNSEGYCVSKVKILNHFVKYQEYRNSRMKKCYEIKHLFLFKNNIY